MSTSEVFQLCLVIIGVVSLVLQANQKEVTARLQARGYFLSNRGGKPSTGSALSISIILHVSHLSSGCLIRSIRSIYLPFGAGFYYVFI